jgi:hypothetical protein
MDDMWEPYIHTRLSDESFCAGLLLRSWHKAGLLPELGKMAQCLRDGDIAAVVKTKQTKRHTSISGTPRKKARMNIGSSDSNM